MPTIADGECFASKIPQVLPSPAVCETYAIIFADGTKGWGASVDWADYDCSGDSDVVKCVRISWMDDGALMPGDQKFTDVAKLVANFDHFSTLSLDHIEAIEALSAERDRWRLRAERALEMLREQGDKRDEAIACAEAAEAEVTRCKAAYARLRGKWLNQVDTIAIYQPVIDAAVAWFQALRDDTRDGGPTLADTVCTYLAKYKDTDAEDDKGQPSHIDDLGMKTEEEIQQGPPGEEEWVLLDLKEEAPIDAAHHPQSEKSCATCRNMDGEMCELSGTMAEFCLENAFTYWCPAAELQKCPQCRGLTWIVGWSGENPCKDTCPKCRGTGIVVGFRAAPWTQEDVSPLYIGQDADAEADLGIDGMGPNGPVLHETDARDGIPSMKAVIAWHTSSKIEKSCGTCDNGHGGECTLLSAAEEACLNSDRLAMWEPRKQFEAVKTCASCQFDVVDVLTEEPCVSCQWPSLSNWQPKEHNRDA